MRMPNIININSRRRLFVAASAQLMPNMATGNSDDVVRQGGFLAPSAVLTGCLWRPRRRVAAHHGHCPQPGDVDRGRTRCYAMAPTSCMLLNLALRYKDVINCLNFVNFYCLSVCLCCSPLFVLSGLVQ
jgi:hypothetical protein